MASCWEQLPRRSYRILEHDTCLHNQAGQVSRAAQASTPPRDVWSFYATPLHTKTCIYLNLVRREGARRRGAPTAHHKLQPHNMTSLVSFWYFSQFRATSTELYTRCSSQAVLGPGQLKGAGDRTTAHTNIEAIAILTHRIALIPCGWQPVYLINLAVSVTPHAVRGFLLSPGGVHAYRGGRVVTVRGGIATVPNI